METSYEKRWRLWTQNERARIKEHEKINDNRKELKRGTQKKISCYWYIKQYWRGEVRDQSTHFKRGW